MINTSGFVFGDFLGLSSTRPSATVYGDSGVSVNWDDAHNRPPIVDGNTNGDALDGLWVKLFNKAGWWDLGTAENTVAIFASLDHGPNLGGGLEFQVWGSNSLWGSPVEMVTLSQVYLDGWRPYNSSEDSNGNGWLSDDITGLFTFNGSYQYITIVAWGGTWNDTEIDAVAAAHIPEPATLLLLGSGLLGMGAFARRRFRK